MTSYSVLVEGRNFPSRLFADAVGLVGFFAERFVEAEHAEAAELAAIELIKNELRPRLGEQITGEPNPTLHLDQISVIEELPQNAPGSGVTWFPMKA